jgi:hypothetical protein
MPPSHDPDREAIHVRQRWPNLPGGAVRKVAALIAAGWYITSLTRKSQRRYLATGRLSNWHRDGGHTHKSTEITIS